MMALLLELDDTVGQILDVSGGRESEEANQVAAEKVEEKASKKAEKETKETKQRVVEE
jgi:hypothetical protein